MYMFHNELIVYWMRTDLLNVPYCTVHIRVNINMWHVNEESIQTFYVCVDFERFCWLFWIILFFFYKNE